MPSAGAIIGCPYEHEMSTPEWNAPSPLNGSILDPNDPVIGPITGHNVGAVVAATQSAREARRFMPMPRPAAVAPVSAELRSAYSPLMASFTCSGFSDWSFVARNLEFGLSPYMTETSFAIDPSEATSMSFSWLTCSNCEYRVCSTVFSVRS